MVATSFANWTADDMREAAANWTKTLQESVLQKAMWQNFCVAPYPGHEGEGVGDTPTWTIFPIDETDPGVVPELAPSPDVFVDWFQVDYHSEEFAGKFAWTNKNMKLSYLDVENMVRTQFTARMASGLEHHAAAAFLSTGVICGATSAAMEDLTFKYNGTLTNWDTTTEDDMGLPVATGARDADISADHLVKLRTQMFELGMEPDSDGLFTGVLSPRAYRTLWNDADFLLRADAAWATKMTDHPFFQSAKGRAMFMGGFPYFGFKFFLTNYGNTILGNLLVGALYVGEAVFFGEDAVMENTITAPMIDVIPDPNEPLRKTNMYQAALVGHRIKQPLATEPAAAPRNTHDLMKGLTRVIRFSGGTA